MFRLMIAASRRPPPMSHFKWIFLLRSSNAIYSRDCDRVPWTSVKNSSESGVSLTCQSLIRLCVWYVGKDNHRWAELQNNCVRWRRHDWWEICARTIWSCVRSDSNSNLIIKYIELKESVIDDFYLGSFFPSFSNFCLQNVNVFSDNFNLLFVSFCLLLNFLEIVFCFGNVCWISRQIWNFVFDGLLGEALNRISALLNH